MPIYRKPELQQWAEQEPSVVESPVMRGLRSVVNALGLADPENQLPVLGTLRDPIDGLLVSKYAKVAKGPGGLFGVPWESPGKIIKDQVGHVASALPKTPVVANPGRGNKINSKALTKKFRNAQDLVDLLANQVIK